MNGFLKEILCFCSTMDWPVTIEEICAGLNEHEYLIASGIRNLEALGLLEKTENSGFVLSGTASAYMVMSETRQRAYEKEHPFVLYRDLDGNLTPTKPEGWDIE